MSTSQSQRCDDCGASLSKPLQCGGCLSVKYCGRECQRAHWSRRHSSECKTLRDQAVTEIIDGFGGILQLSQWLRFATRDLLSSHEAEAPPGRPTPDVLVRFTALAKAAKLPIVMFLPAITVHALELSGPGVRGRGSPQMKEAVLKELKAIVATALPELGVGDGIILWAYLAIGRLLISLDRAPEALAYAEGILGELEDAKALPEMIEMFLNARERFLRKSVAYADRTPDFSKDLRRQLAVTLTVTLGTRKAHFECVKFGRPLLADPGVAREEEQLITFLIADALSTLGCHEEAVKTARRGLEIFSPLSTEVSADHVASFKLVIAEGLAHMGEAAGAMAALQDAVKICLDALATPSLLEMRGLRAVLSMVPSAATVVMEAQGMFQEAVELDNKVLAAVKEHQTGHLPHYLAAASRRAAQVLFRKDDVDEAEDSLREALEQYRELYSLDQVFSLHDPDLQALWACNLVLADVLDKRGTEAARQEARLLRADVQESKAIEKALQDAMLDETREEARRIVQMQRGQPRQQEGEEAWAQLVSVGGGGGGGKGRKARKRRAKKGRRAAAGGGAAAPTTEEREVDDLPALEAQDGEVEADSAVQQQEVEVVEKKGEADREDEEDEEGEECAICCLAMVEEGEGEGSGGLCVLKCSHRFHRLCMSLWVDRCRSRSFCPTCPYCRVEVHHSIE